MCGDGLEEINRKLWAERGVYQYRYDKLNRLTEVLHGNETVSSYAYDAFGNRIRSKHGYEERRYEYNGANQLLRSISGGRVECYQYDKRGNLTEIVRDDKAIHRYRYDETNRLAEAVNGSGQAVRYEYNGLGNRTGRREYRLEGFTGGGALPENPALPKDPVRETEYLLDLTRPYFNLLGRTETIEGEAASQTYIWDSNVVYATEGESAYLYLQDELGSTVRLVKVQENNSQEMRQTVYGYDEFGNDRYGTQGEVQPFGYTGYQRDTVADTYFAQAREYLPKAGRFGGEDWIKGSIATPFTLNSYGYCWGNPVGLVDLDGKVPVMWGRDDPRTWYVENLIQSADRVFRETGNEIQEALNPANWIPNSSVQWVVNKLTGTDITEAEAELIKKYPWGAKKVLQAASRADEWTDKIFGSYYGDIGNGQKHWLDGDPANAYRHAMWNAFITKYMGSGAEAKKWTDAHEAWPREIMELQHGSGFTRQEHTNMDFFNNAVGRNAVLENGFDLSEEEISNIILEKLKNGEMKFIVDHGWYQDIIGCTTSQ